MGIVSGMKEIVYFVPTLFVILLASGCSKQNLLSTTPSTHPAPDVPPHQKIVLHDTDAITLNDLPIPLGFDLITYEPADPITFLCFQGKLATEKIISFFETDTDRNGWKLDNLASPSLATYYITKPGKKAIITIEQKVSRTLIRVNLKITGN